MADFPEIHSQATYMFSNIRFAMTSHAKDGNSADIRHGEWLSPFSLSNCTNIHTPQNPNEDYIGHLPRGNVSNSWLMVRN